MNKAAKAAKAEAKLKAKAAKAEAKLKAKAEKAEAKLKAKAEKAELKAIIKTFYKLKAEAEAKSKVKKGIKTTPNVCMISDITTFFTTSTRGGNDAANKTREGILKIVSNPPPEYLQDPVYGPQWAKVQKEWNTALDSIAGVPFTRFEVNMKGGRCSNYDADIHYYNDTKLVSSKKVEFKYGGTTIQELPQFISLQAKFNLFPVTYDTYYYEHYLDAYISCDEGITEPKTSLTTYLKLVTKTASPSPFFAQLKLRETTLKEEKNKIVNSSITAYLTTYGPTIDISAFYDKIKATQTDKIYLLWSDKFYIDTLTVEDMEFYSIKNGNTLQVRSGNTIYNMLLRWRNHKGILNPAWQIGMKRFS